MSRIQEYKELIAHIERCSGDHMELINSSAIMVLKQKIERESINIWISKNKNRLLKFIELNMEQGGFERIIKSNLQHEKLILDLMEKLEQVKPNKVPKKYVLNHELFKLIK